MNLSTSIIYILDKWAELNISLTIIKLEDIHAQNNKKVKWTACFCVFRDKNICVCVFRKAYKIPRGVSWNELILYKTLCMKNLIIFIQPQVTLPNCGCRVCGHCWNCSVDGSVVHLFVWQSNQVMSESHISLCHLFKYVFWSLQTRQPVATITIWLSEAQPMQTWWRIISEVQLTCLV